MIYKNQWQIEFKDDDFLNEEKLIANTVWLKSWKIKTKKKDYFLL